MKKADYDEIASEYDKGRKLLEPNVVLWLDIIARYSGVRKGARLLDLGCGTGRFSIPITKKLGYQVTGADYSEEMLEKAREKDRSGLVKWDVMDAQSLTYPDNSFDIVFMSFLLHHCDDQMKVIRECWRVLDEEGVILVRHAEMEQIRYDVEHTFFPETLAVDGARIYTVQNIEDCLRETGFTGVVSEEILQRSFETGTARLEAILVKNTSALRLITQKAYERGVVRLKKHIKKNPDDPWLLYDKMTITAGYKR